MLQLDGALYIAPDTSLNSSTSLYEEFIYAGDTLLVATQRTIVNSTDSGYAGEICIDSNYLYYCVADNTWKRIALNSW
jgi:hypothetical protein